ncbi:MAG: portal protein, partial [Thermomicrobium sp.]|nr:portal protein [Thermomicrobium sp.]
MTEPARLLEERFRALHSARSPFEETWQTIARYCLPRKASFYEVDPQTNLRRERLVLDSTAPRALEMFASFLHSSLSSPTSQWFDIVVRGQNPLDPQRDVLVQKWAEQVKRVAYAEMISGPTNVYSALHELYLDLGAFGTGVLYVEWDDRYGGLRFHNFHLASVVLDQGEDGEIDTMIRRVPLTAR